MARRPKKLFRVKGLDGAWVAEPVTSRMRSVCFKCGSVPCGARVVHKANPDPFPTSTVYCKKCAAFAASDVAERIQTLARAAVATVHNNLLSLP